MHEKLVHMQTVIKIIANLLILKYSTLLYFFLCIDDDSRSCAVGFLKRQSLLKLMIADTSTDVIDSISTSHNAVIQNRALNETGQMIKFVIAAKFNHSAPSGWPALQI